MPHRKEVSPQKRSEIVILLKEGYAIRKVSEKVGIPKSTVSDISVVGLPIHLVMVRRRRNEWVDHKFQVKDLIERLFESVKQTVFCLQNK